MKELNLFTGAGGGALAGKLLGWETLGYVEFNEYCQRVIRQRIDDGIFDDAPIFGDIRAFLSEGYADSYQGMVDIVSGGFPCQPFSVAGKRAGADDPRNMWPATIEIIRRVKPKFCFLENVPGLLSATVDDESGRPVYYFGEILRDLAESGYDAKWRVLSAAECGAPHKRDRLWIVATDRDNARQCANKRQGKARDNVRGLCGDVSNSISSELRQQSRGRRGKSRQDSPESKFVSWWAAEPDVGRVAHGVASRVDRLKPLGNGQVPAVAAKAFELLTL